MKFLHLTFYLIIIFIQEIVYLLKFFKKKTINIDLINIHDCHKNNEEGMVFINYLFGKYMITTINSEQSKIINYIKNWDNVDNLREILTEKNEIKRESLIFIKFDNTDFGYNDADSDNSGDSDYDPWIDIN